jgi:hypothetical protein
MVFLDFEKAFDSIDREMLWKILRHYGIPSKIVRMIQVLYDGFQARVLHEGKMAEPFSMTTGVRQSCLLSSLLFLVALEWVTGKAYGESKTGIQFSLLTKLEDLEFADDIVLLSQKIAHAREKFEALQDEAAKVGLKVNKTKTKEMRVGTPSNAGSILCKDQPLERVESFTYLGSIVNTAGGSDEDVETRCRKAQAVFYLLRSIWKSKYISLRTS